MGGSLEPPICLFLCSKLLLRGEVSDPPFATGNLWSTPEVARRKQVRDGLLSPPAFLRDNPARY